MSLLVYAWVSRSGMSDSLWQPMDFRSPQPPRLQARILVWVAIPFSRVSSWPRGWTLWAYSLLSEPPGKALYLYTFLQTLTCLACYALVLLGCICFLQGIPLLFTLVAEWQSTTYMTMQFTEHCSRHIPMSQWMLGTYCCMDTKEETDVLNTQLPFLSLLNPG